MLEPSGNCSTNAVEEPGCLVALWAAAKAVRGLRGAAARSSASLPICGIVVGLLPVASAGCDAETPLPKASLEAKCSSPLPAARGAASLAVDAALLVSELVEGAAGGSARVAASAVPSK